METLTKVEVCRGFDGRVDGLRIMFHPELSESKEVIRKALNGEGVNSGFTIKDGIMVFSADGDNVPIVADHEALMEIRKRILRRQAYTTPADDGFYEGIAIMS